MHLTCCYLSEKCGTQARWIMTFFCIVSILCVAITCYAVHLLNKRTINSTQHQVACLHHFPCVLKSSHIKIKTSVSRKVKKACKAIEIHNVFCLITQKMIVTSQVIVITSIFLTPTIIRMTVHKTQMQGLNLHTVHFDSQSNKSNNNNNNNNNNNSVTESQKRKPHP